MREVELRLANWKLAELMGEVRKWLDHRQCTPEDFDIVRRNNTLVVRIVFVEDELAEAFLREFSSD